MPNLYRGKVKNMYVKKLEISADAVATAETDSYVLHSDALFYESMLGKFISFDYDTVLPNAEEAQDYVENYSRNHPNHLEGATCLFISDGDLKYETFITRRELKKLKKDFKQRKRY